VRGERDAKGLTALTPREIAEAIREEIIFGAVYDALSHGPWLPADLIRRHLNVFIVDDRSREATNDETLSFLTADGCFRAPRGELYSFSFSINVFGVIGDAVDAVDSQQQDSPTTEPLDLLLNLITTVFERAPTEVGACVKEAMRRRTGARKVHRRQTCCRVREGVVKHSRCG